MPPLLMKSFLLLLLFYLPALGAQAQGTTDAGIDYAVVEDVARHTLMPLIGLYVLCNFALTAIKQVLTYLLKKQMVAAGTPESVVERLLPGPENEQNKVVKWVALLTSIGIGLAMSTWFLPLGIHSIIIMVFSTALGFLGYYIFLRRRTQ